MARIRTVIEESSVVVVLVQGRLGAADVRRLEEACAPALTTPQADLIVDVQQVTVVDRVAQAHLHHIETRGAVIRRAADTSG
jgi:anti-anti-sigma regulatory factor